MSFRQARWNEPLIFELGYDGRTGFLPPTLDREILDSVGEFRLPQEISRAEPPNLPSLSEVGVVRHYTRLSQMSYGVDIGPLPLGSCTMKYNPKIALKYAFHEKLAYLHPLMEEDYVQGLLEVLYKLERWLEAITGMDYCSIHPAAGAHGELAGALVIRKYHELRGKLDVKKEVIIPDSAHGTNPATGTMAGFKVIEVPTDEKGNIDLKALRAVVSDATAGLMITNPNTLGLFDTNMLEVEKIIHEVDGLIYYDGANLNGILGYTRPGDMGVDVLHLNLHKTFSSPHGGGGPGAGPVCVKRREVKDGATLADIMPGHRIICDGKQKKYAVVERGDESVGLLRAWIGNISPLIWSYVYILSMGPQGLREAGEISVLNTNYFIKRVITESRLYTLPYDPERFRKHEVTISASKLKNETGVTAEDVAKALLDSGLHAPIMYFPLIVEEALMIEFTESETKEVIDVYIERLKEVERKALEKPEEAKTWPRNTAVTRVNNVKANHPRSVTPTWRVKTLRDKGLIDLLR